jgi:hypothetical protein
MPLYNTSLQVVANQTIFPNQFLSVDPTRDFAVVPASGNSFLIGISQVGTKEPPNLQQALFPGTTPNTQPAATQGDNIEVFHVGDVCGLVVGSGTVGAGDQLTNDGNGNGLTAITGYGVKLISGAYIGAIAQQAGNPGEIINVLVAYSKS